MSVDNGSRKIPSIDGTKGPGSAQVDIFSLDNGSLPYSTAHVIHNLEDKSNIDVDDQGSAISSLDYNWSVDGVDTPWRTWPVNKRAPYLQESTRVEDSRSLPVIPAPVEMRAPAITRGADDTIDV